MLNKLQKHVEQEEIRWRQQYETLEPQIQILNEKLSTSENKNEKVRLKFYYYYHHHYYHYHYYYCYEVDLE